MKALQIEKPQHWRQIEIPEPQAPQAGEALVRVQRVGICGTDFSGYLGKMPFFSYPRIPGHELGVVVLSIGEGVTNVKPGDRWPDWALGTGIRENLRGPSGCHGY